MHVKGYPFRGFKSMGMEFDIYQVKLWNQFFFFSVESPILTKMYRLTIAQRIKVSKPTTKMVIVPQPRIVFKKNMVYIIV